MSQRKTTEDYKKDVFNKVGNEYSVLGEYINNKTKIKMRHNCDKCNNHEYYVTPNRFLSGDKCPKCKIEIVSSKKRMSESDFIKILNKKGNNEYELLNEYKNSKTKVKLKHKVCNNIFEMTPHNFITSNNRCPHCAGNNKLNTAIFKDRIYKKYKNEYTVLGKYKNNHTKIKMRHNCDKCNNHEWLVIPRDFMSNKSSCPICSRMERDSKSVKEIESILNESDIFYIREKKFKTCKNIYELPFDFYLPDYNLLIEYDGEQHYHPWGNKIIKLKEQQKRDKIKDKWCKDDNIKLLRIPYTEKKNLYNILEKNLNIINNSKK